MYKFVYAARLGASQASASGREQRAMPATIPLQGSRTP